MSQDSQITVEQAYRDFYHADTVWSDLLQRTFGRNAGDVRFTSKAEGAPGSALNNAYMEFARTGEIWRRLINK